MVLLTTTPHILRAISSISSTDRAKLNALPTTTGAPVEHKTVIALSRLAPDFRLHSLLHGASVYIPPPPPKPAPSPGYVALMDQLRKEQEVREYRALITKNASDEAEVEEKDDISPSLVFNILVSVLTCAGAVFYLTRYWHNDGVRVLLSLFVGIAVGVAEVTVYASYLRKVKTSRNKERSLQEKKELIGPYEGPKPETSPTNEDQVISEKEEIWGRGVNGGMRRRVRDKWEKEQSRMDDKE